MIVSMFTLFINLNSHVRHDMKESHHVDIDPTANQHDMEFYNFKHYDTDDNYMLDGLEVLREINHDYESSEVSILVAARVPLIGPHVPTYTLLHLFY